MTHETRLRLVPRSAVARLLVSVVLVVAVVVASLAVVLGRPSGREAEELARALGLRTGMTVAEIGAGAGALTVEVARRVGPAGHVYSTELNASRLDQIRAAASEAGLSNVTVVEAGEHESNLAAGCCDAIFMRRVYHHLSDASAILRDLSRALKAGGTLVIIEFEAGGVLGAVTRMGIDQTDLVAEVSQGGFELVRDDEWPQWGHYVAVFRKVSP